MTTPLARRVDEIFAPGGALSSAFPGFEPRGGQRRMARAVAAQIDADAGVFVVEAGTGIGKTLAYLIPAVLSGRRVLVSTGTRNLQDQIFYKDIPAVSRALGIEIKAAYMKGRTNYLCLHRFAHLREAGAGLPFDDRRTLDQIAEWAAVTETGDRAEIEDLPEDSSLWQELTATSDQCLGRDCPEASSCFVTRMRERAADAAIVVVNHHLLCADAAVRQGAYGAVIPDCEIAVIDEAHQLEDIVTQYFGVSLSPFRFDELVRDATSAERTAPPPPDDRPGRSVTDCAADVTEGTRQFFDNVRLELRMQGAGDRMTITADVAERLNHASAPLREALDAVVRACRAAANDAPDLGAIAARATALSDDLQTLLASTDPNFVRYIETRGRAMFLRAAPIDVAATVRDAVIGARAATLLTSATLTVEGAFDYALGRLGIPEAATLRVPSEFDYRTHALLYLPPDLPDPRSADFNRAAAGVIAELLERSAGRAFVLFTSYQALHEVHGQLNGRLPWPMLVQGTASRTALLRSFRATPNSVLFATSSFWQGVDVAGEALSCVIVDRLPFASPSDPLVAARIAATQARGGHPFHDYQVPLATLTLLQGLGRLIRTHTDRGVLAVLDPRLRRMHYGHRFLASLPPAPLTTSLDDVARFFGQLSAQD